MVNGRRLLYAVSCSALFISGCQQEAATLKRPTANDNDGRVTFFVDGMTERLGLY